MHPSIQYKDPVQTRTTNVHSRLAIKTQPWGEQRLRNTRNGHKYKCKKTCMDIQDFMMADEIWLTTTGNEHIGVLSNYILHGWPSTKAEVQNEAQPNWSFRDKQCDWWDCYERRKNYNTHTTTVKSMWSAACQPHEHTKDETPGT